MIITLDTASHFTILTGPIPLHSLQPTLEYCRPLLPWCFWQVTYLPYTQKSTWHIFKVCLIQAHHDIPWTCGFEAFLQLFIKCLFLNENFKLSFMVYIRPHHVWLCLLSFLFYSSSPLHHQTLLLLLNRQLLVSLSSSFWPCVYVVSSRPWPLFDLHYFSALTCVLHCFLRTAAKEHNHNNGHCLSGFTFSVCFLSP